MKNTTTITFELQRSVVNNKILMTDKVDLIKQIKEFAYCDLRTAKNIVDQLAQSLQDAQPDDRQTRLKIHGLISDMEGIDLLDVLQFINVTMKPKPASKLPTTGVYHNCGDECRHQCEYAGCDRMISFHDEPFCFTHSPDEGSSVPGYDSRNKNPF